MVRCPNLLLPIDLYYRKKNLNLSFQKNNNLLNCQHFVVLSLLQNDLNILQTNLLCYFLHYLHNEV